jgi:threonine dehydrogenase-like Zn-dependent dehydrogenase
LRAVVTAPGGTELTELPEPSAAPDEVVVKVEACGICGSDVHAVEHGFAQPGRIMGHEFSGTIVGVGKDVKGWQVDQTVAVNPLGSCGTCYDCTHGLAFRCTSYPNLGLTAQGAYAEYTAVRAAQLVAFPAGVDLEIGSAAEPLAVAIAAVDLGNVTPGDAALVFGVGTIGLNVIAALRLAGAGQIVAVGRSPGRRAAAAAVGADVVLDSRETDLATWAADTKTNFASAYECSASTQGYEGSLKVLAPAGTFVEVALAGEPVTLDLRQLLGGGLRMAGSCAFGPGQYERAVAHLRSGEVPAARMISERVGIDELSDALVRLRHPGELVRVLVQPWRTAS